MNKETIEAIQVALAPVAEKIGQGAAFGWEVVVRQQYVEGIIGLIAFGFFSLLLVIALVMFGFIPWNKTDPEMTPKDWIYIVSSFVLGLVSVFGFLFSLINLFAGDVLGKLINPEYYALQFFITLGKSAVGG